MLTLIFLSFAVAAQGQYPYPPAAPYPPAVRVIQPVTPVAAQSGRLQATHFRSEPYPPAQPVLLAPASTGPYPPAQPPKNIAGGEISPVEQDLPKVDHTTYGLPSLSSPEQLRAPTKSYPLQPEVFRSAPASYPTQYAVQYPKSPYQVGSVAPSSYPIQSNPNELYPTQSYSLRPKQVSPTSSYPSYPSRSGQSPSYGLPNNLPARIEPFQSGGEVSPDELEIPPNSQINLQDKRLQYSHGFSDDKGTAVREQGSLLSTNDGWEYVIAKRGSYSYTSPEGKLISVNYIADDKGFRVLP